MAKKEHIKEICAQGAQFEIWEALVGFAKLIHVRGVGIVKTHYTTIGLPTPNQAGHMAEKIKVCSDCNGDTTNCIFVRLKK